MKIAITSLGESPEAPLDQRFGRTRFFVLFDLDSAQWSVYGNKQNLSTLQGAGIEAARFVIELGVAAVITGHCGPKAFTTLAAAGVDVYQNAAGSVRDAFDAYRAGALAKSEQADVEAGFGSV